MAVKDAQPVELGAEKASHRPNYHSTPPLRRSKSQLLQMWRSNARKAAGIGGAASAFRKAGIAAAEARREDSVSPRLCPAQPKLEVFKRFPRVLGMLQSSALQRQIVDGSVNPRDAHAVSPTQKRRGMWQSADKTKAQHQPYGGEVDFILPELYQFMRSEALNALRHLFAPRFRLHRSFAAKRALSAQFHGTAVKLTIQQVRGVRSFAMWPEELLNRVVSEVQFELVDRGDIVAYRGEPYRAGVAFLTSGSVTVASFRSQRSTEGGGSLRRVPSQRRSSKVVCLLLSRLGSFYKRPASESSHSNIVSAPACFGDHVPLSEQAHPETVRALTKCDVWWLPTERYMRLIALLPENVMSDVMDCCFVQRNDSLRKRYPITAEILRENRLFCRCPESVLNEISYNLIPFCVPKNFRLFDIDKRPDVLLLLVHGRVAVRRRVANALTFVATVENSRRWFDPLAQHSSRGNVRNNAAFQTIGEAQLLRGCTFDAQYDTLTQCDCYKLSRTVFDSLRLIGDVAESMYEGIRGVRAGLVESSIVSYRDLMLKFPLARSVISRFQLLDMVRLFHSVIYRPMSVVCSTSTYCDRIVVVLKGSARIGSNSVWAAGDYAGFTGIVPHRWGATAIAHTECETLEMPMAMFIAVLKDANVYEQVRGWCLRLMFPKAFPPDDCEAIAFARQLSTIQLAPLSNSRKVEIDRGAAMIHSQMFGNSLAEKAPKKRRLPLVGPRVIPFTGMKRISTTMWTRRLPTDPIPMKPRTRLSQRPQSR